MMYFEYGEKEINYLRERDPQLGAAIDQIGHVYREVVPELFSALVLQIISQQISTKGAITVWNRLLEKVGELTAETISQTDIEDIQGCGMSMRKAQYMKELANAVLDGTLDLSGLEQLTDEEVCQRLSQIKGIGVWTAEMLMTFTLQRPDVISFGDIAILRGMRMLYRHRKITPELFNKYKRRYSPHATVASLYLWEISGGACEGLSDPAPMTEAQKKAKRKKQRKAAVKNKEMKGWQRIKRAE